MTDISVALQSLASWQIKVKESTKIKEAGQDLLEDFKETRAKVKEKMDEIVQVRGRGGATQSIISCWTDEV